MEKQILKFHIGRGGRFYNSGYMTFKGFERIDEGRAYDNCYFDENGEFMEGEPGNAIDIEINEDGTGYINHDYDYDTTICMFEDELTDREINALIRESKGGYYAADAKEILEKYYPEYID